MNVSIIGYTICPMDQISIAAGTSYGRDDVGFYHRVTNCYALGHLSVFEHATVTMRIEGISRACSHQLVRHRMASYVQQSQRYTEVDDNGFWYVVPPSVESRISEYIEFRHAMQDAYDRYKQAIKDGVPREDARYMLPEATKTTITMTVNVRELFHFFDLRMDEHAQWEIRELAECMYEEVRDINGQWRRLMELYKEGEDSDA